MLTTATRHGPIPLTDQITHPCLIHDPQGRYSYYPSSKLYTILKSGRTWVRAAIPDPVYSKESSSKSGYTLDCSETALASWETFQHYHPLI